MSEAQWLCQENTQCPIVMVSSLHQVNIYTGHLDILPELYTTTRAVLYLTVLKDEAMLQQSAVTCWPLLPLSQTMRSPVYHTRQMSVVIGCVSVFFNTKSFPLNCQQ